MVLFSFFLDNIDTLVEATSVIADLDDIVDLKFSADLFAIIAESSIIPSSIIALQLAPQFFQDYICRQLQYSWIDIDNIYPEMLELKESGFKSLEFSFAEPKRADLRYGYPHGTWEVTFRMHEMDASRDVAPFNYDIYVSMDSQQFINLVTDFNAHDHVYVSLTSTQAKFSCPPQIEIVLTEESGQCLIGGVQERIEISFTITLHPMEALCNMARKTERLWIFKAFNSADGVIYAPFGMHAQYLAYPPDMRMLD